MRFTEEHIQHYQENGFVIVENFLTTEELALAHEEIQRILPGWLEFAQDPQAPKPEDWNRPPKSRRNTRFPFAGDQLNAVTLHPDLRKFAALNAGHEDLVCEQGDLHYKCFGHASDMDQVMHLDYLNHTLVYPPKDPKYWQTAYLIYYTDVTEELAPTAVCSWKHYQEDILWPTAYEKEQRSELYENEVLATVPAGSVSPATSSRPGTAMTTADRTPESRARRGRRWCPSR